MTYNPNAKYYDQPWQTVTTLRELAREQDALLTEYSAKLGACDYIERIEHTPNAWRIYGCIDALITEGYDADHIISWLEHGRAKLGDPDTAQRENLQLRNVIRDMFVFGAAAIDPDDEENRAVAVEVFRATLEEARRVLR